MMMYSCIILLAVNTIHPNTRWGYVTGAEIVLNSPSSSTVSKDRSQHCSGLETGFSLVSDQCCCDYPVLALVMGPGHWPSDIEDYLWLKTLRDWENDECNMLLLISDGVDDDVNLATACRRLRLLLECLSGVVMIAESHQHLITMISWSHLRKNHNKSRESQDCQQYQRWLIIERCLQITFLFNIVTNNILTWDIRC